MLWTAFVLGFIGSLHCLGMCGPIVLVLPRDAQSGLRFFFGRLAYVLGKAVTYGMMGIVVGLIGQAFLLAGFQQWLGIITGSLMILSVLVPGRIVNRLLPFKGNSAMANAVKQSLGKLLARGSGASLFAIGLLNGFLPCGLVYTALAAAMTGGTSAAGALFMFVFGIGTAPALIAFSYAEHLLSATARIRLARFLPVGVVLLGLFFILRGASLGIPFLSPKMNAMHHNVSGQTIQIPSDSGCCSKHNH